MRTMFPVKGRVQWGADLILAGVGIKNLGGGDHFGIFSTSDALSSDSITRTPAVASHFRVKVEGKP